MRRIVFAAVVCSFVTGQASAQNWSFDARKVGMGSTGGSENLAQRMIEDADNYRAIVIPLGLFQVLGDLDRMDPSKDDFDIIQTVEYAAAPLHYTFGRHSARPGAPDPNRGLNNFVTDIRNAELSRDLNRYRGAAPSNQPRAEGLASPSWGKTFKVKSGPGGAYQGVFVGAGPYFAMQTDVAFDQQLINILGSETDVFVPNASMTMGNTDRAQMALAIVGGYRGRFALPAGTSDRDGVYVAANYNFLHGFLFEDVNLALRLDTDRTGLLTVNPLLPSPVVVSRDNADSGTGRAIDLGLGVVLNGWEVGFGVNGIANRIKWTDVERTTYSLNNLFQGSDFVESPAVLIGEREVELPVDYRGNLGYRAERWSAMADAGNGYGGKSFHGGYEYRFTRFAVRGGGLYSRGMWNPAAGVGVNLGGRVWLDAGLYSNAANIERERRPAIALSLRFNR